jgi:hypothetical protein
MLRSVVVWLSKQVSSGLACVLLDGSERGCPRPSALRGLRSCGSCGCMQDSQVAFPLLCPGCQGSAMRLQAIACSAGWCPGDLVLRFAWRCSLQQDLRLHLLRGSIIS